MVQRISGQSSGSASMAKRLHASPSMREHAARKLASVEERRSHPPSDEAIARLLTEMQSPDEQVRADAVRQVCPCRLPWETFYQVRAAAKRLQHDPSPLVRANARHVEEDAQELAAMEAMRDWTAERDAGVRAVAHRLEPRGERRQPRGWWRDEDGEDEV